jgi:NAD(P)-dependent dehydrogenase (short-subunit alcohol dehydrogenase family)
LVSGDQSIEGVESISGRVAVIVGAAGGLGHAIARRLAAAGCRLALLDLDRSALEQAAAALPAEAEALPLHADITDAAAVREAARAVSERFGRADILVNAAGINTRERTLDDMSPEQWERVIAVDLNGVFHCVREFLDIMRRGGGGVIVTIASTAALLASAGAGTHYSAAKRALLSLTESINIEQGRHGVRACALSPGEVNTSLVDRRPNPPGPERRAAMLQPVDVAEAVYYIVTRPARVTVGELVLWPSVQISGQYTI